MLCAILSLALVVVVSSLVPALWPAAAQQPARQNVLVELFTSEGCSSCPPADLLLIKLQRDQPVPGVNVITLSEHVDYWNALGWKDPFSSPAYSQRQMIHAAMLHQQQPYTPEMFVDGKYGFAGSDYGEALSKIRTSASQPKANITVSMQRSANQVTLKGKLAFGKGVELQKSTLYAAVVEDNLRSDVSAGENEGHVLTHSSVVRELLKVGALGNAASEDFEQSIKIDPEWKQHELRVVVFAESAKTMATLAAAELKL
jgi:hypothetical protein